MKNLYNALGRLLGRQIIKLERKIIPPVDLNKNKVNKKQLDDLKELLDDGARLRGILVDSASNLNSVLEFTEAENYLMMNMISDASFKNPDAFLSHKKGLIDMLDFINKALCARARVASPDISLH